jgi:hypothetical protein
LLSGDPKRVEEGKRMVSKILPFLLLGGFSNAEIVAYLKAKLEAAKTVLKEVMEAEGQKEEEETKVEVDRTKHAQKSMVAHAEIPEEEKPAPKPEIPEGPAQIPDALKPKNEPGS